MTEIASQPLAWVTGANGLIGHYLVQTAPRFAPGWRVRALTRADFDLLDFAAMDREFRRDRPQLVVHCAAVSTPGAALAHPDLARRVNVEATGRLAALAAEAAFLFLSSDHVFDGLKGHYVETDAPNPPTLYAETKLAAEQIILQNPRHTVVRTSLNGGISRAGARAFNEQIRRAWEAGQTLNLFTDEFRSPIAAVVTARALWELAGRGRTLLTASALTSLLSDIKEAHSAIEILLRKQAVSPAKP